MLLVYLIAVLIHLNMKNLRFRILLCTSVCVLTAASFIAANVPVVNERTAVQDTLNIGNFLQKTSMDYAWELNLSKQIKIKTRLSRIREYAVKTIDMCILANKDMQAFAGPAGVTLADSASVPQKIREVMFAKKPNSDINKTYLLTSISNHQQIINRYEKAILSSDTAIVSMAKKHLRSLRRNLEMAKFLSKNLINGKLIPDGPPKEEDTIPPVKE
ncbi:hypothetical protein D3C87_1356100 [compost metagenome]